MHFPIIKLEKIDTKVEDFDIDLPEEDPCLLSYTDYYGEIYNPEDRKNVINSVWLANLLDGYATIDTEAEAITFLNEDIIRGNFKKYLKRITSHLVELAKKEKLTSFDFRWAGIEYQDNSTIFCFENYCQKSFEFIADAFYHAGETWKIGNIFDAHF